MGELGDRPLALAAGTAHWYQVSSQATVIRAASGVPAAAPIETRGSPRVRVRPATVRAASLALNRVTASSKLSAGGGDHACSSWDFSRITALVCSWETRDSVTPRTSPISRRVRFS